MVSGIPLLVILVAVAGLGEGDHERPIKSEGLSRRYQVHVPPNRGAAKRAWPVVVVLHPIGGNSQQIIQMTDLNDKADRAGFLAVYPEALARGATSTWTVEAPDEGFVDDVKFIDKVLDDLAGLININPRRVYVVGFSAGGIMAYRLASELSDRIAAVASVAGPMPPFEIKARRPVPVMHMHGTKDTMIPYKGPDPSAPRLMPFRSVDETIRAWVKFDGCPETPVKAAVPHDPADGLSITRTTYGPGTDDAEVVLYTIEGGGHAWPGRKPPVAVMGLSPADMKANDIIWEFFRKHPMK
jgi:polyhydroxybutyrate depolymerase